MYFYDKPLNFAENKTTAMNNVLIIGNGFDLDLGLKTSYYDFYNSEHWVKEHETISFLSKMNRSSRFKVLYNNMDTSSLFTMLENNPVEDWNEMERIIEDFAKACDKEEDQDSKIQTHLYELQTLSERSLDFIKAAMQEAKPAKESAAARVLKAASKRPSAIIYNFNLTDLKELGETISIDEILDYRNVHGSVNTHAIIGAGNKTQLSGEYDVFKKMFAKGYRSHTISQSMEQADNIIIFGHSLSDQDSVYFKDFFMKATDADSSMMKRITIVTKDDNSRHCIIRNLEKLTDGKTAELFQNNIVRIFTTDDLDEKEFDEMIQEITR